MQTVCGLDVHKDSVFACIVYANGMKKEEKYDVLTPSLERLRDDLLEAGVTSVAMESTSIYWVPIQRILNPQFDIWIANPLFIKQMPGRKNDQKDAEWIAELHQSGFIKKSFVPNEITIELRRYERRYFDLRRKQIRVATQMDTVLQSCNIRISNYLSHINRSKSYEKVLTLIIAGETSIDKLLACIHGRTRNKHGEETMRAALRGVIKDSDRRVLRQMQLEKELIEGQQQECITCMQDIVDTYCYEAYELLLTLPGVKQLNALCIIAELGTNMECFETSSKLVGWAGLKPRNDESAGKIKSRKTTKGNKYLKITMTQAAWSAARTKGSRFNSKYTALRARHVKEQKALTAIARKMLVIIWNMLTYKTPFDPDRHLLKPRLGA